MMINFDVSQLRQINYASQLKQVTGQNLSCDVAVIGTGAGGAAAAYELTKPRQGMRPLSVLALEAGPYVPLTQLDQNLYRSVDKLAWGGGQAGTEDGSLRVVHGRVVGGSTMLHMLTMTPLTTTLWESWRQNLGLEDLISSEAMLAKVAEIKQIMNIKPLPRERLNANSVPWTKGCDALGYLWRVNERNAGQCVGLGRCHTGCAVGGKVSMDVSFVPRALNQGLGLVAEAFVQKIEPRTEGGFRISVVHQGREEVQRFVVYAKQVVVAAGAIQTPGLLLRSKLQNKGKMVGGRFCVQPGLNVVAEFEEIIDGYQGVTNGVHIDEWQGRAEGGFFIEPGMLDASIISDYLPGVGKDHRALMERYRHLSAGVVLYSDSGRNSRVYIKEGSDKTYVDFNLTEADHKAMRFALEKACEILIAGGAKAVYPGQRRAIKILDSSKEEMAKLKGITFDRHDFHFESVHVHGSCPMGPDETTGVVDAFGECHHHPGLFIADASTLPGPICMNTTVPAATLGLIAGERLVQRYYF